MQKCKINSLNSYLKNRFIFFILWFSFSLQAETKIERIVLESYPKVQILLQEGSSKIQNETLSLTESSASLLLEVEKITLIRKEQIRPLYVLITLQASSWENNKYMRNILESLLVSFSSQDKFGLQIYSDSNYTLEFNLTKETVLEKLKEVGVGEKNKIFQSLNYLYSNIPNTELPILHLIISFSNPSDLSSPNSVVYEKAKQLNVSTYIIGREHRANLFLASALNGKFFPILDPNIIGHIQNSIYQVQKYPTILEYETPFYDFLESFPSRSVQVNLEIDKEIYKLEYEVNLFTFLKGFLSDVKLVLGVFSGLLCFLILISYAIYQRKKKLQWMEYVRKQEEIRKSDLYYHENKEYGTEYSRVKIIKTKELDEEEWKKFEQEEFQLEEKLELTLTRPKKETQSTFEPKTNLPKGEVYSKAFLIQKEGPNPGRQFVIYQDEINIGRSPENQLVLLDSTVSLQHAKIKKIDGVYYIYDLVSERGVYINGKKLLKPRPLYDFDEIRLGKIMLLFRGD